MVIKKGLLHNSCPKSLYSLSEKKVDKLRKTDPGNPVQVFKQMQALQRYLTHLRFLFLPHPPMAGVSGPALSHMQNQSAPVTWNMKVHLLKLYTLLKKYNSVKEKLILWSFRFGLQMGCHFKGTFFFCPSSHQLAPEISMMQPPWIKYNTLFNCLNDTWDCAAKASPNRSNQKQYRGG